MAEELSLPLIDVRKLLAAGNSDASLLYLYLRSGGTAEDASTALHLSSARATASLSLLRQLGLVAPEHPPRFLARPDEMHITDGELRSKLATDEAFRLLTGEVQRQLGRLLSTEELRILAGITGYLGMPTEVVGVLITYCLQLQAERGGGHPSMRMIEKVAYQWADEGINTLEQAAAYLQANQGRRRVLEQLSRKMRLGRSFRAPEEEKVLSWMDLGFGAREIYYAYERCILSIGELKWPYIDRIIRSWHSQGLHTLARIQEKDVKPGPPAQARGPIPATSADTPGELERRMVERLHKHREEDS